MHASACNLKKNNCEKKAIKNLSPPTSEDERKKICDIWNKIISDAPFHSSSEGNKSFYEHHTLSHVASILFWMNYYGPYQRQPIPQTAKNAS